MVTTCLSSRASQPMATQAAAPAAVCTALMPGAYISLTGTAREEQRALHGMEIAIKDFTLLAPITNGENLHSRDPKMFAILRIRAAATAAFRDALNAEGFFEMHSPAVRRAEEGDAGLLRLNWFGEDAVLTGSPRRYLIQGAAALDRVMEISQAFSAARHNSPRHLAGYTRLDFEMNYINNITDVMAMTEKVINALISGLNVDCADEVALLGADLPKAGAIPAITFTEAMSVLGKDNSQPDLDPTDEAKLSAYANKTLGSELLFVTHLPAERRPVYEKAAPDTELSEGFVLLCRSGGEHVSVNMPRHGGCGIGLERLLMKLLQLPDIRLASPFPRDMHSI